MAGTAQVGLASVCPVGVEETQERVSGIASLEAAYARKESSPESLG